MVKLELLLLLLIAVNFKEKEINFNDIYEDGSLKILGKGNKERVVYLNKSCRDAIENYKKTHPDFN